MTELATKQCPDCLEWLSLEKFESDGAKKPRKLRCSVCHHAWRLAKEQNYNYRKASERRLVKYGLTEDQFESLKVMQGGVCAICKHVPESRSLVVDHNHDTGAVRGLLCWRCNVALGFFDDKPEYMSAAIAYLVTTPFENLI